MPNCQTVRKIKKQENFPPFRCASWPRPGWGMWYCRTRRKSALVDNSFTCSKTIRHALQWISIPAALIMMLSCHQATAQEAETAPTCTGCSNSNTPRSSLRGAKPRSAKNPQLRAETGSLASYNGAWGGVSSGGCIATWNWTIQVSNGIISGNNVSGRVSRAGSASGHMVVLGTTYIFAGHLGSSQASGTWTAGGGCSGRWTAAKS